MGVREAWSFSRNAKTLVVPPTSAAHAAPLDGFRALAVVWVVAVHGFLAIPSALTLTPEQMARFGTMYGAFAMRVVHNGGYGVDIFFALSGFLIMAILRRELERSAAAAAAVARSGDSMTEPLLLEAQLNSAASDMALPQKKRAHRTTARVVADFFLRRFVRLTPAYVVAICTRMVVDAYTRPDRNLCAQYFWRNLLFIQNFFPYSEMCMSWSWSIAVEWQMYMVSPLIVWGTVLWPRSARWQLAAVAAASLIIYMANTVFTINEPAAEDFTILYANPLARMFAYIFGMAAALEITKRKDAVAAATDPAAAAADYAPTWRSVAVRVVAIVTVIVIAFSQVSDAQRPAWRMTLALLARPVFAAAMVYIMYDALLPRPAGADRYQDAVNRVLSSRPLYVIAQVSYGIYLFHPIVMEIYTPALDDAVASGAIYFNPQWIFPVFTLLFLLLTTLVATIVYLLVEKPMLNLVADLLKEKNHT